MEFTGEQQNISNSTATVTWRLKPFLPRRFVNLWTWNVLTDEWFKGEKISGSRSVPLDKVGNEVRSTNLPKNAEIVVYCGGPKCPQSRMAAEKLIKLGYEGVRAYEGGLEEWKGAGLAVEKA
jgi:rhodanese-related sulfurtransferase